MLEQWSLSEELDRGTKSLVQAFLQQSQSVTAAFQEQWVKFTGVQSELNLHISKEHIKTRNDILDAFRESKVQDQGHNEVANEATSRAKAFKGIDIETQILRLLSFWSMTRRYDGIRTIKKHIQAYGQTCEWINQRSRHVTSSQSKQSQSSFAEWLEYGHGVFWIAGKAGSGKSTLMKFLEDDPDTQGYLKRWAKDMALISASYFFWNSGDELQKSSAGLLRSLLHFVLSHNKQLIPVAFSERWFECGCQLRLPDDGWTLTELLKAFKQLLAQDVLPAKFCFLIDGLDEFNGDHNAIVKLLRKIPKSSNVKICVSSRPLLIFEEAFGSGPNMMLQDLTHNDIYNYVSNKLEQHPRILELKVEDPKEAPALVEEIVSRASGVFLWVKLAVRSLLEGLRNYDSVMDLQTSLHRLPTELESLYLHMLQSVGPMYRWQAWRYLQIIRHAKSFISPLILSFVDEDPDYVFSGRYENLPPAQYHSRCLVIERRLKSRCQGLLEVEKYTSTSDPNHEPTFACVRYLHQSVGDFLMSTDLATILPGKTEKDFNVNLWWMRLSLIELKLPHPINPVVEGDKSPTLYDFLAYAHCVEESTGQANIRLMDAFDITIAKGRFHQIEGPKMYEAEARNPFHASCVRYDTSLYIGKVLDRDPQYLRRKIGRPLLFYALQPSLSNCSSNYSANSNSTNPKLVQILLERGANPNQRYNDVNPWTEALALAFTSLNRRERREESLAQEARQWIRVFHLFIEYGADPFAFCEREYCFEPDAVRSVRENNCSLQMMTTTFYKYVPEEVSAFERLLQRKQEANQREFDLSVQKKKQKLLQRLLRLSFRAGNKSNEDSQTPVSSRCSKES